MKYKVTNKLEQVVRLGELVFSVRETKVLDFKPYSDRFIVEEIEETEKKINSQGGIKNGNRTRHLERSS